MISDNKDVSTEPDFSDFADWQTEEWSKLGEDKELTAGRKRIVEKNASLLLKRDDWIEKTRAFEAELMKIHDELARENKRAEFFIRFDGHKFMSSLPSFENYHFPCSVSFYKVKRSSRGALFDGATFVCGDVSFEGANFEDGNVSFRNVQFGKAEISFADAVIKGNFFIQNNTYRASANFQRLSVGGTADFSKNTFHKVPDFTDSKFDRPPDVSGMEVLAFKGWKVWKLWVCPFWNAKSNESAKFRKLKAMALAANDHEKDGEFFAYEMLAKRGYETKKWPDVLFNWLYFTSSRYGQSFKRPFVLLIISLLTGWGGYGWWIGASLANADRWWFALDYSFRNFLPLFGSLFRFAPQPSDHESWFDKTFHELAHSGFNVDWLTHVGIAQNFVGLILLFLLLLGLRNKFRLK